jgi:hypothetical protein
VAQLQSAATSQVPPGEQAEQAPTYQHSLAAQRCTKAQAVAADQRRAELADHPLVELAADQAAMQQPHRQILRQVAAAARTAQRQKLAVQADQASCM